MRKIKKNTCPRLKLSVQNIIILKQQDLNSTTEDLRQHCKNVWAFMIP